MPTKKHAKATATKKPAAERSGKAIAKSKKRKSDDKMSAIDAAAKVLAESAEPMSTKEMIQTMAAKGYWSSAAGATPDRTLYSALLREMNAKGKDARFVKTERGKFNVKR
jgi:hypothetical protein